MFVEETREPDMTRLTFLRWLIEHDRMEHPVVGPASGELVVLQQPLEAAELPLAS